MITLGWFGTGLLVLGAWGVGNKARMAFLATVVGEACWILKAGVVGDTALATVCVVFLGMAIRNYIKWGVSE